ncbi:nucleoside triphosphate hydrolase protein [Wolfiporia cocos MD-104 SS10]|uniref:Nucleoside triphosphate hydrolase protein n=1 Tax=Wolfiporia cocos (strain MD-104) TaxID=742152 RepID=A0A2H3JI34_WOLCO|nr:nucleoside triphosphate hydrolase protein [Wolfiporia cocos MD-104 SS10]
MRCSALVCSQRRTLSHLSVASSSSWSANPSLPVLEIDNSSVYALGNGSSQDPILRDISWTIQPNEAWAVLSAGYGSSKRTLFNALVGKRRIHPLPARGIFPFLDGQDPTRLVRLLSHERASPSGEFVDFTARYGAIRDENKRTLRETYFPETAAPTASVALPSLLQREVDASSPDAQAKRARFERLVEDLKLTGLLDLPVIALSNGQTRRAHIAKALLRQPAVLILDEPLTGLDVETRSLMVSVLHSYHASTEPQSPHIILGLRPKDPLPDWVTHLALVTADRTLITGRKEELQSEVEGKYRRSVSHPLMPAPPGTRPSGYELVRLSDLSVSYGDKRVLKSVNWEIRENSRWQLMGENGAGKTTLLAMLTGEHPQSFAQSDRVRLFGRPRASWPTRDLTARIGRFSPELHRAFPRRVGMTVWDVVGTGFGGEFVPRGRLRVGVRFEDGAELERDGPVERWRVRRMWTVLEALGPRAWRGRVRDRTLGVEEDKEFAKRHFVDLTAGEQSMVLLMRALVGRPLLVLLDEVWAGMDDGMVQAVWRYLADGGGGLLETQACVVISHWEDEVPWSKQDGVRKFLLKSGEGREVE